MAANTNVHDELLKSIPIPIIKNYEKLIEELIEMEDYGGVFNLKDNDNAIVKCVSINELYAAYIASISITDTATCPIGPVLIGYCIIPESERHKYNGNTYLLKMEYIHSVVPKPNIKTSVYESRILDIFRTLAINGICNNDINKDSFILQSDGNLRLIDYGIVEIKLNIKHMKQKEKDNFVSKTANHMMSRLFPKKYESKNKSYLNAQKEQMRLRLLKRLQKLDKNQQTKNKSSPTSPKTKKPSLKGKKPSPNGKKPSPKTKKPSPKEKKPSPKTKKSSSK
jgi:hypothetical protein